MRRKNKGDKREVMGKSVYSVLLNDKLVDELDKLACEKGVSRSVMLDRILADYFRVETPDQKMLGILSRLEEIVAGAAGMRFVNQPSVSMASIQSALSYRYNPTVRYSVELYPSGDYFGKLKVTLRAKNPALTGLMGEFYRFYAYLENKYAGKRVYSFEDGRYERLLEKPGSSATETAGESLASFVGLLDSIMKDFFANAKDLPSAYDKLEKKYAGELSSLEL